MTFFRTCRICYFWGNYWTWYRSSKRYYNNVKLYYTKLNVISSSALIKKGVKEFFERGIVKDYFLPLVDSIAKDVVNGNPPDLSAALVNVVEGRIFDKLKGGVNKLLGYLDESK